MGPLTPKWLMTTPRRSRGVMSCRLITQTGCRSAGDTFHRYRWPPVAVVIPIGVTVGIDRLRRRAQASRPSSTSALGMSWPSVSRRISARCRAVSASVSLLILPMSSSRPTAAVYRHAQRTGRHKRLQDSKPVVRSVVTCTVYHDDCGLHVRLNLRSSGHLGRHDHVDHDRSIVTNHAS